MKNSTVMIDALYNVQARSGASNDYAAGLVVGVVSTVIAERGCSFDEAISIVTDHLPWSFDPKRLPEAWREDFEDERNRKEQLIRETLEGCDYHDK